MIVQLLNCVDIKITFTSYKCENKSNHKANYTQFWHVCASIFVSLTKVDGSNENNLNSNLCQRNTCMFYNLWLLWYHFMYLDKKCFKRLIWIRTRGSSLRFAQNYWDLLKRFFRFNFRDFCLGFISYYWGFNQPFGTIITTVIESWLILILAKNELFTLFSFSSSPWLRIHIKNISTQTISKNIAKILPILDWSRTRWKGMNILYISREKSIFFYKNGIWTALMLSYVLALNRAFNIRSIRKMNIFQWMLLIHLK